MNKFNLTENEIKVLIHLNDVKNSDDREVADVCNLTSIKEAEKILNALEEAGFVKGIYAPDTGYVSVWIIDKGRQVVREINKPWYKKVRWIKYIKILLLVGGFILAFLTFYFTIWIKL